MNVWNVLIAISMICTSSLSAHGAVVGLAGGPTLPGDTLGAFAMTPFSLDLRPEFSDVTTVDSPLGGVVGFDNPLSLLRAGGGWATWSNSYVGSVYYGAGLTSITMSLPSDTVAFYFYAEPNEFIATITATTDTGETLSQDVLGFAGASYFGFYSTSGETISSVTVSSDVPFAIGQFGIATPASTVPEPSMIATTLLGLVGIVAGRKSLVFG